MGVRNYTDKEIIDRLKVCDGYRGLPNGVLDVWVRSNEDAFNKFDDKVYTFECSGGVAKFVMLCTGTSNAGAEGLKHYDKYNREGCAVLNGNQIVYGSHGYGLHRGKYPAYRQVRPFPYYRDGDKDNRAEEIGPVHNDIIGANCHKAGWFSTEIGGWSVACLVRNSQAQYDAWMRFMNRRPLSVAILDEWVPVASERVSESAIEGPAAELILEVPAIEKPAEHSANSEPTVKPADTEQPPATVGASERWGESADIASKVESMMAPYLEKFDKVNSVLTGVSTRADSAKSIWATIGGTIWQVFLAVVATVTSVPREIWMTVAVITGILIGGYLLRQIILGFQREKKS